MAVPGNTNGLPRLGGSVDALSGLHRVGSAAACRAPDLILAA